MFIWGLHLKTGQFYYGYRCGNVVRSTKDLGIRYFTSSDRVKEIGFENFEWHILQEFFTKNAKDIAYWREQKLIAARFSSSKCLNNSYVNLNGKKMYKTTSKTIKKMKRTIANRTFEEREVIRRNMSLAQRSIPKEKQALSVARRLETLANKTKKEKLERINAYKNSWIGKSKEERAKSKRKQHEGMSDKKKKERALKISNTLKNKSEEKKAERRELLKVTWANKSEKEKIEFSKKMSKIRRSYERKKLERERIRYI